MKLQLPQKKIKEFCKRNHIKKLSIFGSAIHDNLKLDSDVDILIDFEEGYKPGFKFFEIEEELSHIIGKKVDLNTVPFLSRYFKDEVLQEAKVQYNAE